MTAENVYAFRPARRSNAKPLVGLYSESGCGKTFSALLLARGFVGPEGRIGMIETESGRGEAYSEKSEYPEIGGYQVLSLHNDFSPEAYGKAITKAEAEKFDALIIDSASHEWEGVGGVLDMAAKNEAAGKKGPIVWQKPKIEHQRHFMLRFMQSPIPLVILCMRAKYPMQKKPGSNDWVRSEKLDPTQSADILFEMFVHGWIDANHRFHRTKTTAKALEPVFIDNEPLTTETGRKLHAWAAGDRSDDHYGNLLIAAEGAADKGLEALREHWKALAKEDRAMLKSQNERLAGIAKRADEGERDHILDGDPPQTELKTALDRATAKLSECKNATEVTTLRLREVDNLTEDEALTFNALCDRRIQSFATPQAAE